VCVVAARVCDISQQQDRRQRLLVRVMSNAQLLTEMATRRFARIHQVSVDLMIGRL
jgi:hypothetical protein